MTAKHFEVRIEYGHLQTDTVNDVPTAGGPGYGS